MDGQIITFLRASPYDHPRNLPDELTLAIAVKGAWNKSVPPLRGIRVMYLLIILLLMPAFAFADELHLDLDVGRLYHKSLEKPDNEATQRKEESREADQERMIWELIRGMSRPKTTIDEKGTIWRSYPDNLLIPLEKDREMPVQ